VNIVNPANADLAARRRRVGVSIEAMAAGLGLKPGEASMKSLATTLLRSTLLDTLRFLVVDPGELGPRIAVGA